MSHEAEFDHITPGGPPQGNGLDRPWLVVLSDWLPKYAQLLENWIEEVFKEVEDRAPLPLILVVDDLGGRDREHRELLAKLTEAGANVLEAEAAADRASIHTDPGGFASEELTLAMQAASALLPGSLTGASATASATPSRTPSKPDGYQEFGTAITGLSPDDLEDMMGRADS